MCEICRSGDTGVIDDVGQEGDRKGSEEKKKREDQKRKRPKLQFRPLEFGSCPKHVYTFPSTSSHAPSGRHSTPCKSVRPTKKSTRLTPASHSFWLPDARQRVEYASATRFCALLPVPSDSHSLLLTGVLRLLWIDIRTSILVRAVWAGSVALMLTAFTAQSPASGIFTELDEIWGGRARVNSGTKGRVAGRARVWAGTGVGGARLRRVIEANKDCEGGARMLSWEGGRDTS